MCQSVGSMERVCEGVVETYTPRGHVVGMLDRDQRTAKVPTYQKHAECQNFSEHPAAAEQVVCRGKVHSWKSRGWRSRVRETAQRLKQVLVVGTYLLSIVSIPSSLSAPTGRTMDRLNTPGKWINPCKMGDIPNDGPLGDARASLNTIREQAVLALRNAKLFKADFKNQLISTTIIDIYQHSTLGFLPTFPKREGEELPADSSHLADRNLENALTDIYENLQRIAVGLEAVTWGQEDYQGKFLSQFNETEFNLRSVLCEIQAAIIDLGLQSSMKPDVQRDVMDDKMRFDSNITSRYPRDWVIYREYINGLEFTIQLIDHLLRALP